MDTVTQEDARGRYMTLAELQKLLEPEMPGVTANTLWRFTQQGMPHDPRGGVFFVYENEARAWIKEHVETTTTYRFIRP